MCRLPARGQRTTAVDPEGGALMWDCRRGGGAHDCWRAKVVSERLRHATFAITLDTYSHTIPAMRKKAALIAGLVFATE